MSEPRTRPTGRTNSRILALAGVGAVVGALGTAMAFVSLPLTEPSATPEANRPEAAPLPTERVPRGAETPAAAVIDRTTTTPVLLVPGWLGNARDLAPLRIRFLAAGWPEERVATLTFEDPTGSSRDHALELEHGIDSLLARTGATRVDIVAHSMGGLATRWLLRHDADHRVRRIAFLGSPHRGTLAAHLAWGDGRDEMMPDSPFLDSLNAGPDVPPGVEAITVRTPVDTHIVPGESATLPGVPDHTVCCPSHVGLLHDEEVFEIVLAFLERGG